jgi:hypothetical protein
MLSSRAMQDIFERGIDPNVDDPTECHVGAYHL